MNGSLLQKPNPKKSSGPAENVFKGFILSLAILPSWSWCSLNPKPPPHVEPCLTMTCLAMWQWSHFTTSQCLYCWASTVTSWFYPFWVLYYKQEILTSIALASSCPKKGSESHRLCTVFDQIWYLKTVILFQLKYRRYWLVSGYFKFTLSFRETFILC